MNSAPTSPPATGTAENPVLASGVVLWSGTPSSPRFLLLQSARHQSWGFAKGHLEAGEDVLQAALREVAEETGIQLEADALHPSFADTSIYHPNAKDWKRVVYFLLQEPLPNQDCRPSKEHQDHRWVEEDAAIELLAYSDLRRTLIRAALCLRNDARGQKDA